jgi:hypothetical protein
VRQHTERRRQTGHGVAVHPDDQARVLAPGIELQRALVLVIRAASRAETAQQPAFDGRGVRGQKAVRGSDLVVGVGVRRVLPEPFFAQDQRLTKGVEEGLVERGSRGGARKVGARLPEVVVDGDGPLLEQQIDPRHGGRQSVCGRIARIGGNRVLEDGEGVGVVKVVAQLQAASPERRCGCRTWPTG